MKQITVKIENCYGISKLQHTFDFTVENKNAIYAPNAKRSDEKLLSQMF